MNILKRKSVTYTGLAVALSASLTCLSNPITSHATETESIQYVCATAGVSVDIADSFKEETIKATCDSYISNGAGTEGISRDFYNLISSDIPEEYTVVEDVQESLYIEIPHTDEEEIMMRYIVECEAHGSTKLHKTIIACVIINRLYSDTWDYSCISEVILAKKQFSSLFNYYKHTLEPDNDTIEAVSEVLSGKVDRDEVSQGALYFYNPDRSGGKISWFENKGLLFEMDGHRFFK
jgi:hypothetical protein